MTVSLVAVLEKRVHYHQYQGAVASHWPVQYIEYRRAAQDHVTVLGAYKMSSGVLTVRVKPRSRVRRSRNRSHPRENGTRRDGPGPSQNSCLYYE